MTAGARRWLFMAISHMSFFENPLNLRGREWRLSENKKMICRLGNTPVGIYLCLERYKGMKIGYKRREFRLKKGRERTIPLNKV